MLLNDGRRGQWLNRFSICPRLRGRGGAGTASVVILVFIVGISPELMVAKGLRAARAAEPAGTSAAVWPSSPRRILRLVRRTIDEAETPGALKFHKQNSDRMKRQLSVAGLL